MVSPNHGVGVAMMSKIIFAEDEAVGVVLTKTGVLYLLRGSSLGELHPGGIY